MYSRITFLVIIGLVCMSVVGTFVLVSRFTREEYQPAPIPPPLPEIPKEEVKEVVFQYTPDVYRDPFKVPIRIATEKPREEIPSVKVVPTPPVSEPVVTVPSQPLAKETKPQEVKPVMATKETKSQETKPVAEVKPEIEQIRVKEEIEEVPPKVRVTGILYDEEPFAIIEFEGHSGIFEVGDKLGKDLIVKKIHVDSVDLDWKGKIYNTKLGG